MVTLHFQGANLSFIVVICFVLMIPKELESRTIFQSTWKMPYFIASPIAAANCWILFITVGTVLTIKLSNTCEFVI